KLYPQDRYPGGHLQLASSLNNVAALLQAGGEYAQALDCERQALTTFQAQLNLFADTSSEAEALNFLAKNSSFRDAFLTAWAQVREADPRREYPLLWEDKAALASILQRRQRLARGL